MKVFACIRYWLYGKNKNNDNIKKEVQKKENYSYVPRTKLYKKSNIMPKVII